MQFRAESSSRRRTELAIDITALVDIVFQLIIFFVLTTTFVSNPGIEVDLPRAKAHEIQHDSDEIVVALTTDGQIILHGKAVDMTELAEVFENAAASSKGTTVILQADQDVAHGRVVSVMDLAKDKGLQRLAIATQAAQ
ncbi:MAG: biopolymer transporter ExbD [Pseudomonadota bacterium]